jgi:pyrroline-5-carboxylate reductase
MIRSIGIIGAGHLVGYLVAGWRHASPDLQVILSPRNATQVARLAAAYGAAVAPDNRAVAAAAEVIVLATRPPDALAALRGCAFRPEQLVISVAASVRLAELAAAAAPARVVRALPLSCAAVNASPTLLCPDDAQARMLFEPLGTVHALADEAHFIRASVISAFYGWVYALLDETVDWTAAGGLPPALARSLVLETVYGAASLALAEGEQPLTAILDALATPGGITRRGLTVLGQHGGLTAWPAALDAVYARLTDPGSGQPPVEP